MARAKSIIIKESVKELTQLKKTVVIQLTSG